MIAAGTVEFNSVNAFDPSLPNGDNAPGPDGKPTKCTPIANL